MSLPCHSLPCAAHRRGHALVSLSHAQPRAALALRSFCVLLVWERITFIYIILYGTHLLGIIVFGTRHDSQNQLVTSTAVPLCSVMITHFWLRQIRRKNREGSLLSINGKTMDA